MLFRSGGLSLAALVVDADDVAGKSHADEPQQTTLLGARCLRAGSDCMCTAIYALGHL